MPIEVGKSYLQTDPLAWPEPMREATITVTAVDVGAAAHELAVAYTFIDMQGGTGTGTMQLSYAQEFLRLI